MREINATNLLIILYIISFKFNYPIGKMNYPFSSLFPLLVNSKCKRLVATQPQLLRIFVVRGEHILLNNKGINIITLNNLNRDGNETNGTIGVQQKKKLKATSPIDHSPPAVTLKAAGLMFDGIKRRRKMSPFNDKENVNELLTKQLTFLKQQHMIFLKNLNESVMSDSERLKTVEEINKIFQTMYTNSLSLISSIDSEKRPKDQLSGSDKIFDDRYSLPAFLTNNKEITVIMEPKMCEREQNEIRKIGSN